MAISIAYSCRFRFFFLTLTRGFTVLRTKRYNKVCNVDETSISPMHRETKNKHGKYVLYTVNTIHSVLNTCCALLRNSRRRNDIRINGFRSAWGHIRSFLCQIQDFWLLWGSFCTKEIALAIF